ncbi:alpha-glucosidase [Brevibacterium sanguinis]|uniref:Alpha-glucosidase n=2 Tax=Brevibacterium TaxID=1696 RepID=A0A366IFD3_9MICO|nr:MULTISPECIES: glycoside hydrolase family 13 protein [Brevibacterium]RBP62546.1 alpha-glucosidase [Brevibacterium sanguinis]RBP69210.1 alpha-glucosidase [Brevibacterium celere]
MTQHSPSRGPLHPSAETAEWWRSAVIYQVYPRSFADADGDGIGDLPGITAKLDHLRELGVDAVWISPFYPSPQADAGYDVSDYCDVDPLFGTLADADALISRAHELDLRIIVDLVPNHTSDQHPWFRRALTAGPDSPERDWYLFRDANPEDPERPPNNWESVFGGPAWSTTPDGQWYLHLFDSSQPDLNWANPQVREAFEDVLRFWLDRGVDGFRVDVAHGLVKAAGLPDAAQTTEEMQGDGMATGAAPYWDQDGVHEIYLDWRRLLDEYPGERVLVAEAWVQPYARIARYVRPGEFHQAFNFSFLDASWDAPALRECIEESFRANDVVGAPTTWVLSNHDVIRPATRLALDPEHFTSQLGAAVPAPDRELGARRARAATTAMLALPGSAYLYQGEELGLFEVLDLPEEVRQDPTFHRTSGRRLGRDGCRVPIPWERGAPAFGFSESGAAWLPQPAGYGDLAVDQQKGCGSSHLELVRRLLALRAERGLGTGSFDFVDPRPDSSAEGSDAAAAGSAAAADFRDGSTGGTAAGPCADILAFDVTAAVGTTRVVLNLGATAWPIPADAEVLAASDPTVTDRVPTDCAVWLAIG